MSVSIIHSTISGADDGRLELGNSQFGAALSYVSSSWYRMRLGMRIAFTSASAMSGTQYFMLGVMATPSASMENGPISGFCTNFVGVRTNATTWGAFSQSLGEPIYYNWVSGSGFRTIHRAGSQEQIGTTGMGTLANSAVGRLISASPDTVRNVFILEIEKVGYPTPTAFSCSIMFSSGSAYNPDISYSSLASAMEMSPFSSADTALSGSYFISNGNVVCDESSGSLTSIVVAWSSDTYPVYISEFLWRKFDS